MQDDCNNAYYVERVTSCLLTLHDTCLKSQAYKSINKIVSIPSKALIATMLILKSRHSDDGIRLTRSDDDERPSEEHITHMVKVIPRSVSCDESAGQV